MSTITKEWLKQTISELEQERDATPGVVNEDAAMALQAMRIAQASLEAEERAEPVAFINGAWTLVYYRPPKELGLKIGDMLYTAPPAPSVDEDLLHMAASAIDDLLSNKDRSGAGVWADIPAKLRRAAMLQGADGSSLVIPDGYALVPVEPTYQMCEAMGMPWERPRFPDRYKAMIAAAPKV
ncbi:TPA: hypothetical protein RKX89_002359 [Enterobacter ludwigii]|nr:hypothetical protein [Enterobacter ludwigii]